MCGLCGMLGVIHWSEVSAHPGAFTGAPAATVRAERTRRAALVAAALAPFRIGVQDFQAASYIVSTPTGRREIVADIQAVWGAVERLRGEVADPLDPGWLAALERQP